MGGPTNRPSMSVYFSPGMGAADVVIGFIDNTEKTLDVAVYSITHDGITEALIRAHKRGVAVRVLVDKVQAAGASADDEKLEAAGIALRRDTQPGLMHHKFAISDVASGQPALASGSFNWTASADTKNAENFIVLRAKPMVDAFQAEFDRIWVLNAPKS